METPDPFFHISASLPSTGHLRHTHPLTLLFKIYGVQDKFPPDYDELPVYNLSNTSPIDLGHLEYVVDQNVPVPATTV